MGEKQSSRDVPDRAPANDAWAEGLGLTAGRSNDGGGYQRQAQAHFASDVLEHAKPQRDEIAKPAPGGADEAWWNRGIHAGA